MNREDIKAVLDKEPLIGMHRLGFNANDYKLSKAERNANLKQDQEKLLQSEESINVVCNWLVGVDRIKSCNFGSYHLKHVMEKDIGYYVSNGEFIIAAIHCGFPYEIKAGSPCSVYFGMSRRSLQKRQKEAGKPLGI